MRNANFKTPNPSALGLPPAAARAQQAQAQAQAMQQQVFLNIYIPTVVNLTQFRVANGYAAEGNIGVTEPATPERVAKEAREYVQAALEQAFVPVEESQD